MASENGLCVAHGRLDMRAIGKLGGRGRTRSVLGISDKVADDKLIGQAKAALEKSLQSDNEQVRLRAAQSLYSYRAAPPPAQLERRAATSGVSLSDGRNDGHEVVGLADILELALEDVVGIFETVRMQDVILRAAERVRELQAASVGVETPKT
jgi:hypothetical protein